MFSSDLLDIFEGISQNLLANNNLYDRTSVTKKHNFPVNSFTGIYVISETMDNFIDLNSTLKAKKDLDLQYCKVQISLAVGKVTLTVKEKPDLQINYRA